MKEVREAEKVEAFDPFAAHERMALAVSNGTALIEGPKAPVAEPILDGLLSALKFIFLYLPGAAAIHLVMIGLGLLYLYGEWLPSMVFGSAGMLIVSTFMVMLGIGKLTDLRYLRVPAMLFLSGAIFAIIYALTASMIPGDFFGRFILYTFPLTLLLGYLVKRRTDAALDDSEV